MLWMGWNSAMKMRLVSYLASEGGNLVVMSSFLTPDVVKSSSDSMSGSAFGSMALKFSRAWEENLGSMETPPLAQGKNQSPLLILKHANRIQTVTP